MSTTVCQRVPPRLDSRSLEPWSIHFKCSQPQAPALELENNMYGHQAGGAIKPGFHNENSTKEVKSRSSGGWDFLQALTNTPLVAYSEKDNVYVHPLAKKAASTLSEKSLEMCTESLGSETGSTVGETGDELLASLSISESLKSGRITPCYSVKKKANNIGNLPPPMSTIRNVKSLREDGRLVIKAVSVESHQSCFEAVRRDGRLKLHLFHEESNNDDDDNDEFDYEESSQDGDVYDVISENEGDDCYDNDTNMIGESEEILSYNDDNIDEENQICIGNIGDEIEVHKLRRTSPCKVEGGSRTPKIVQWEPFWVASS